MCIVYANREDSDETVQECISLLWLLMQQIPNLMYWLTFCFTFHVPFNFFKIVDTGSREITVFIPVVFDSNLLSYCKLVRNMANIADQDEMLQNGHLITLHAG